MGAYDESIRSISLDADSSIAEWTSVPGQPGSSDPNNGKQYRFVKVTGAHTCGLAIAASNEIPVGVLQNKPQVTGAAATVALRGVSLVECAGDITPGAAVKVNNEGKAVAASLPSDAALVRGIALGSGANGKLAPVLLRLGV